MPKNQDPVSEVADTEQSAEASPLIASPDPSTPDNRKVIAYFPEKSDTSQHHAAEATKHLVELGVVAKVVHGGVYAGGVGDAVGDAISRIVVDLPQ